MDEHELDDRLRQSQERLSRSGIRKTPEVYRIWSACVEQTVGYGREADSIYVTTLAKMADVARQTASRTLLRFDEEGVFVWRPAKRGSKGISRLELPALDVTRDAELDVTRAEEALLDVTRDASEPLDVTREGACRNTTSKPFATASDVTSKPFTTASDVVEEHQEREAQEPEVLETKDLEQEDRGLGLDLPGRLPQSGAHTPTPKCVRDGCDEEVVPLTALCGEHLSQFQDYQDYGYRRKDTASF